MGCKGSILVHLHGIIIKTARQAKSPDIREKHSSTDLRYKSRLLLYQYFRADWDNKSAFGGLAHPALISVHPLYQALFFGNFPTKIRGIFASTASLYDATDSLNKNTAMRLVYGKKTPTLGLSHVELRHLGPQPIEHAHATRVSSLQELAPQPPDLP